MPKTQATTRETYTEATAPAAGENLLENAVVRLAAALDRVEDALTKPVSAAPAGNYDLFRQENTELKQERDHLNGALAELKQRYEQLKRAAAQVASKLDGAIERIDTLAH